MFGEALTPPMAADLLDIARDWAPDLLVHEHAELAAPLVGAVLGVPSVTHSFGTAVPVGILDESARAAGRAVARARPRSAAVRRLLPGWLPRHLPAVRADDAGRSHPAASSRCGPCPGRAPTSPRPAEPLVYVTLGTVQQRPELLREVVAGVAALPVEVLVAVGPRMEPASLGEQPAHVRVEAVGRPGRGARPMLGGRLARRLRHVPGCACARAAPALPAAGGRPVPERRGR